MSSEVRNEISVFPKDSNPYGVSYAEWTARWWQWILSLPKERSPALDETGENCAQHQNGPVWFLAGTMNGTATRHCIVPEGLAVLFPILNHGGTLADKVEPKESEEELILFTKSEIDVISDLEVMVDGLRIKDLENYRVSSPLFDVVLPKNSLFEGPQGPTRGVSDGYWVFLKPLSKGKHHIKSNGSCRQGTVNIGIQWDIIIQ